MRMEMNLTAAWICVLGGGLVTGGFLAGSLKKQGRLQGKYAWTLLLPLLAGLLFARGGFELTQFQEDYSGFSWTFRWCYTTGLMGLMIGAEAAAALTGAMAELTRGSMNLHIGMIESYMTVSYEKLILDDLLIGELKRICSPVKVDEETLVFDLIKKVGPQGEFITDKHTARNFRKNIFYSPMIDRSPIEKWQKQGALTFEQKANLKWKELLEKYEEPGLDPELDKEMQKYLK